MKPVFGLAIMVCMIALVVGYFGGAEITSGVLTILKTITSGAFAAFTIMMIIKSKNKSNFALSALLASFSILWFAAELIWSYYNQIVHIQSSISVADPIWLTGYGVLFVYLMSIVWPIRKAISQKILLSSVVLAFSYLIPSFIEVNNNSSLANYETIINLLYPVADAVLLVPLIICFSLFGKTGRYLLWPLLIGLFINIATDTLFLFAVIGDSYYFGNPLELGFVVAYIILAYGAYRQYRFMTLSWISIPNYLKSSANMRHDNVTVFSSMSLIITTATIVASLSLIQIYQFGNLSTREIMIFQPLVYGGIVTVLALCAVIVILGKKFIALKSEMIFLQTSKTLKSDEHTTIQPNEIPVRQDDSILNETRQLRMVQERLASMEKSSKKTTYAVLVICGIVTSVLLFYMFPNSSNVDLTSGRFVVEDLNGKNIDTWVTWAELPGETLHIDIVNSQLLSTEKINAIKNAILSEDTITVSNSELGKNPPDEKNVYYKGWKGALNIFEARSTSIHLPNDFVIDESDVSDGDILIILSIDRSMTGDLSDTKLIVDGANHEILKSTITIYDIENLDNEELAAITRHAFGHALGLYLSDQNDMLLYHAVNPHTAYISECNLVDLISLYNENPQPSSACE